jgi:hypothetical protein
MVMVLTVGREISRLFGEPVMVMVVWVSMIKVYSNFRLLVVEMV